MARIGRNSPCPCGSGRKYKRCCGSPAVQRPGPAARASGTGTPAAGAPSRPPPHTAGSGAATRAGLDYLLGRGTQADPARGIALIESAAQAGDARGAYLAATIASCSFWRQRNWTAALDLLLRAARAGHDAAARSLRILAGGPGGEEVPGTDWAAMRDAIKLDAWLAAPAARTIRASPRMQAVEGFVPPAACDWLIDQARNRLSRATIYDKSTGGTTEDDRRTNSEFDLDIESCGVLTFVVRGRIATLTGRQDLAMEVPKILHYQPGETFAEHFDYLNPSEPAYAQQLTMRGQRTDTLLIYLNDDYTGGETHFPRLGVSNRGAKGDAFLFANVDAAGQPDENTMHAGLPPTSGEKWLFSQWIREFPRA